MGFHHGLLVAVIGLGLLGACPAAPPVEAPAAATPQAIAAPSNTTINGDERPMQARGLAYHSALEARALVAESLAAHLGTDAGDPNPALPALSFSYTGALDNAGHLARPGQENHYLLEGRYAFEPALAGVTHEGSLRGDDDDDPPLTTATVLTAEGGDRQDYGEAERQALAAAELDEARAELAWTMPHAILDEALRAPASLRHLGEVALDGRAHEAVDFVDRRGRSWTLYLDRERKLLTRVEGLVADAIEGDAAEWFAFSDYVAVADMQLPGRRLEQRLEPWSSWRRSLTLSDFVVGQRAPTDDVEALTATNLAEGVVLLALPQEDCKVLLLAFADFSVVLEAPLSSEAGEAILAAAHRTFPDKPVRYLAMSHHHPHYSAGLRPFVHAGVTLLTTPGNQALLESIASRPHRLDPDALQLEPRAPIIELVTGSRSIADESMSLELIDIGPASTHTDEYLLFYLPGPRLLFEGDLGWLPAADPGPATARRARRLLGIIDGLERPVERVVQSWPLADQRPVVDIATLRTWAELDGASGG